MCDVAVFGRGALGFAFAVTVFGGATAFASAAAAQPVPFGQRTGGLFVADQSLDAIWITRDLDGDGAALSPGEASVFFDASNASGLPNPTGSVFSLFVSQDRSVFAGDGGSDTVYRLHDHNNDRDANDAGEAVVWFSAAGTGLDLATPNGLWQDAGGVVYIVSAGTSSADDVIYRTVDLNGDGDAEDAGEASVWFDLEALVPNSAAFELVFIDDVAYFVDLLGSGADAIIRAEDANGNGSISASEWHVFIDEANPFGVDIGFALDTDGHGLYVIENVSSAQQSLVRLEDLDGDSFIGDFTEFKVVWQDVLVPAGFSFGSSFALAVGPGGELALGSGGGTIADNVFRLRDLGGDGDFLDPGETGVFLDGGSGSGDLIDDPRALAYALPRRGDVNADDAVDFLDIIGVLADWGACGECPADQDFDGQVGFDDLLAVLGAYDV